MLRRETRTLTRHLLDIDIKLHPSPYTLHSNKAVYAGVLYEGYFTCGVIYCPPIVHANHEFFTL